MTFERDGDGTRVTIRYDAKGRGLLMLLAPLFAKMGKRQLEGDFPRLRELMTSRDRFATCVGRPPLVARREPSPR